MLMIKHHIFFVILQYQFVTPLTSMVVTLPDNSKAGLSSDTVEKPIAAGDQVIDCGFNLMDSCC